MDQKIIHFGEFVRWNRLNAGKTTEAFARDIGLTARRIIAIEAMAAPDVQHTTIVALAKTFGIDPEDFDRAWRNTPVPVTRRKAGPTTDEAQRFTAACRQAGIMPVEGMRRLRSWLVAQPQATQKEVLSFPRPDSRQLAHFNDLVDHLQNPEGAVRKRVGHRAASSAKSRGSASTSDNKRR